MIKKAFRAFSSCSPPAKIHDGGAAGPAGQVAPNDDENPTTAGKRNSVEHPNHRLRVKARLLETRGRDVLSDRAIKVS
jgi:hypothetical protein